MKMFHKGILVVLASMTLLSVNASAYSDKERINDMQMMEKATQQMQKGFLYNNISDIKAGAALLKKHAAVIQPPIKQGETYKNNYAYTVTKREAKEMIKYTDEAVANYEAFKPKQAMNSFTKVLKQCMTCHARIRKW